MVVLSHYRLQNHLVPATEFCRIHDYLWLRDSVVKWAPEQVWTLEGKKKIPCCRQVSNHDSSVTLDTITGPPLRIN